MATDIINIPKFLKIYDQIIKRSKERNWVIPLDFYTENHHIVPRSLGGNNKKDNKVRLTAREHFICHLLLAKIYGGKMWFAANLMSNDGKHGSKVYSWLKESFANFISNNNSNRVKIHNKKLDIEKNIEPVYLEDYLKQGSWYIGSKFKDRVWVQNSKTKERTQVSINELVRYTENEWLIGMGKDHVTEDTRRKMREIHINSIWIYDPLSKKEKRVKEEIIISILKEGWELGRIFKSNGSTGYIYIQNGILKTSKPVPVEEFNGYLQQDNGWFVGRGINWITDEIRENMGDVNRGRVWIFNDKFKNIRAKLEDIDDYLDQGWQVGYHLDITKLKEKHSNYQWMYNKELNKNKLVKIKDEHVYLAMGYSVGRQQFRTEETLKKMSDATKQTRWVHNEVGPVRTTIKDIEVYLAQGWNRGRGPRENWSIKQFV